MSTAPPKTSTPEPLPIHASWTTKDEPKADRLAPGQAWPHTYKAQFNLGSLRKKFPDVRLDIKGCIIDAQNNTRDPDWDKAYGEIAPFSRAWTKSSRGEELVFVEWRNVKHRFCSVEAEGFFRFRASLSLVGGDGEVVAYGEVVGREVLVLF
ncbi:hypothetical protein QBC34DRAFT_384402 [Podospora aff. communis PSN243]|uniref:Uncharacterized protein n=1 Tax=Podospora aff. communis PSN243 TaxID=3040156 RepID=A0AAV9GDX9_9PEZI|nr:hypothetical protein QBC34DRAFT_384402 [Podospora aff. communis PSN243]